MNLCPNARCLVGEYVNIYHCDQSGKIGELYMADMQIYPRMRAGEIFKAKTVELVPTEINFGVIQETSHYKRKLSVNLLTDQGWLHMSATSTSNPSWKTVLSNGERCKQINS